MGRYTSGGGSEPRSQIITLTASNPALAIPSWAQGGKGILRIVAGCGGGGGGGGGNAATYTGGDGGSAAFARGWDFIIPAGKVTVNAVVAAAGTGGALNTNGVAGGHTEISFNGDTHARIRLKGGNAGTGASGSANGISAGNDVAVAIGPGTSNPTDLGMINGGMSQAGETAVARTVFRLGNLPFSFGNPAAVSSNGGAALYRATPFGFGTTGFGGGGAGGGVNQAGGNGGPGLLILQFLEAL